MVQCQKKRVKWGEKVSNVQKTKPKSNKRDQEGSAEVMLT